MKRAGHRQHHGAPDAFGLRDLDRTLDGCPVAGHHDLPAAVVVRRLHDLALRCVRRDRCRLLEFDAE